MRVLLVEDDHSDVQRITEAIRSVFPSAEVVPFETEEEFRLGLDSVLQRGLDLAVIDALVKWTSATPKIEAPQDVIAGTFLRAGARCAERLASDPRSTTVPVIIYSAADRSDLHLPPNTLYVKKDSDSKTLLRLILSVLQGAQIMVPVQSVFIVHGHDVQARETVARFVERLDLKAVILHEQPNKGRTIIEKFEEYSAVPFALVLLTPDDVGSAKNEIANQKGRARQNVVLELGFFVGKLGRNNVCALYKHGVEIPSDYQGVLYIEMDDAGAWQAKLVREMRAAGLSVDLNRI
jgi:predicted nucleotide-binding protein